MKKLTVLITSLTFALLSVNTHAHGFQNKRFGSSIGYFNSIPLSILLPIRTIILLPIILQPV